LYVVPVGIPILAVGHIFHQWLMISVSVAGELLQKSSRGTLPLGHNGTISIP
jgi:hypothetical protein